LPPCFRDTEIHVAVWFQLGNHAGLIQIRDTNKSGIMPPLDEALGVAGNDGQLDLKIGHRYVCLIDDRSDDYAEGFPRPVGVLSAQHAGRAYDGLRGAREREQKQTRRY
jgi:ubiquinone biosynthesis protein UbiJ